MLRGNPRLLFPRGSKFRSATRAMKGNCRQTTCASRVLGCGKTCQVEALQLIVSPTQGGWDCSGVLHSFLCMQKGPRSAPNGDNLERGSWEEYRFLKTTSLQPPQDGGDSRVDRISFWCVSWRRKPPFPQLDSAGLSRFSQVPR